MFRTSYLEGLTLLLLIRIFYRWQNRSQQTMQNRVTSLEILLLCLAAIEVVVIPVIYIFTSWLNFVDYQVPTWPGYMGTIVFALALLLLQRTRSDLNRSWSQSLELRRDHQPLSLHNWIAGWSALTTSCLLYFLRVPREEQMMLDQFGAEYRHYMKKTGRIIPPMNLLLGMVK